MTAFRLPDVGEGLDEAEIVTWLVAEGDTVTRDQPLVEILTDKSQTELPSPQDGVITRLGAAVGDIVPVGDVLVEFDGGAPAGASSASAESAAAPATQEPAPATAPQEHEPAPTDDAGGGPASTAAVPTGGRPKAAPVVRRRALDAGVDLASVDGTGPGGRITVSDLDRHLAGSGTAADGSATASVAPIVAPAAPPAVVGRSDDRPATAAPGAQLGQMPPGSHPLRGVRRLTADAMSRSWEIPHIHGNDEADATVLLAARRRMKGQDPEGAALVTPLTFFVAAVANGLQRYPLLNGSIDPQAGTITVHDEVNIGIAVASDRGLYVPVIRNADRQTLYGVASEVARLSTAVRTGAITSEDMSGGTATISNYGSLGGRFATPIIRAPEVLIVGFGSIRDRPFVVDGAVVARPTLPVSVAVDHRLIDGDLMTAFQEYVIAQLSDPVMLLAR
ncbi:MAG: dihydrolipoamide acetyltransferase family protein [Actinomycetota bacterium]